MNALRVAGFIALMSRGVLAVAVPAVSAEPASFDLRDKPCEGIIGCDLYPVEAEMLDLGPAFESSAEEPAAVDLPADDPPVDQPPADDPPADDPPVDEPPADEPPADEPPADEPPADEPPVDEPPVDEPPADEPPECDDCESETADPSLPEAGTGDVADQVDAGMAL